MNQGHPDAAQRGLQVSQVSLDIKRITAAASGATTLTPAELLVKVTVFTSGTHTITLPAAAQCAGRFCSIYFDNTGGGDVALASNAGDLKAVSVGDNFTAAADYIILYCNGLWWEIIKEVST